VSFLDNGAVFINQDLNILALSIDTEVTTADGIDVRPNALTTGKGCRVQSSSSAITSGELLHSALSTTADGLANKTAQLNRMFCGRTETRTTGTTADDFAVFLLDRNTTMNGAGGTMTSAGSVLKISSNVTETAGTLTSTAVGILFDLESRSPSDVYGITMINNNSGPGSPGGIDFSSFSVDEPLFQFRADAATAVGAIVNRIAVVIGGVTQYIFTYAHGT
jgi:hypothetical protein